MKAYFVRRFLFMIPLLGLISFIAFALLNLTPLDPAEVALRVNDVTLNDEAVAEVRAQFGLDLPFLQRYGNWLWAVLHLDLGHSFLNHQPVLNELMNALPVTLSLAGCAFVLILIFSFSGAFLCVWKPNSWLDHAIRAFMFVLTAIPNFWLALLLMWWLSLHLGLFPISGLTQPSGIILPAVSLALGYIGTYLRLIRGAMLNQLRQPYVFYAKARGFSAQRILFQQVLPNSLHSILTALGMSIPKLIAGSVVIENIFALPGLGRLCIQAIFGRDYPMIQAYILLIAVLFLLCNLAVDLLHHWRDPRLKGVKG